MNKEHVKSRLLSCLIVGLFAGLIGVPEKQLLQDTGFAKSVAVPGSTPALCIGYNVSTDKFGQEFHECPAGYAAYGVGDPGGKNRKGDKIPAVLSCCPLPSADILSKEKVFVAESCPESYVATGTRINWACEEKCTQLMQCQKINDRYQLGEHQASKYWGNGFAGWQGSERVDRADIPVAIRLGMGREKQDKWDVDGCVGYPWGSLFTKKTSKYCGGMYFRQLQFSGLPGDPPAGTPVKMFPDCVGLENAEDPKNARCVPRNV